MYSLYGNILYSRYQIILKKVNVLLDYRCSNLYNNSKKIAKEIFVGVHFIDKTNLTLEMWKFVWEASSVQLSHLSTLNYECTFSHSYFIIVMIVY